MPTLNCDLIRTWLENHCKVLAKCGDGIPYAQLVAADASSKLS